MSTKYLLPRPAVWVAGLLCALCLTAGGPALAQSGQPDDELFVRYYEAVYAAAACEGRNLYQDSAYNQDWNGPDAQAAQQAQARLAEVIGSKTGHAMGASNRLSLIEQAKSQARTKIFQQGCQGEAVQELLALFESDLAPAL